MMIAWFPCLWQNTFNPATETMVRWHVARPTSFPAYSCLNAKHRAQGQRSALGYLSGLRTYECLDAFLSGDSGSPLAFSKDTRFSVEYSFEQKLVFKVSRLNYSRTGFSIPFNNALSMPDVFGPVLATLILIMLLSIWRGGRKPFCEPHGQAPRLMNPISIDF